ncbi:MAG: flagellar M-ring protein FliF C-terminal domain-containing protein [Pseudomonadota bacterium]
MVSPCVICDIRVEDRPGGEVTVASNLPDGDAEATEDDAPITRLRRNEEVVYVGGEIERVTEQAPGAIQRLSIAVLLNQPTALNEDGETIPAPRSAEELAALEALVTSAAGLDTDRGDSLTLRTLPFEVPVLDPNVGPTFVDTYVMPRAVDIGQIILVGLIAIILGLFVVKPLLAPSPVVSGDDGEGSQALPADAASLLTMLTEENPDDVAAILDEWFEEEQVAA